MQLNYKMSMQQSNYIIEVKGVSKFFGDKMVLDNINLYVKKGEFVTSVGARPVVGKTTLLRLIAGFLDCFGRRDKDSWKRDHADTSA